MPTKAEYHRLKKAGKCVNCGRKNDNLPILRCKACSGSRESNSTKSKFEAKRCKCGRLAVENEVCEVCLVSQNENSNSRFTYYDYQGEKLTLNAIGRKEGIFPVVLYKSVAKGLTVEEAVSKARNNKARIKSSESNSVKQVVDAQKLRFVAKDNNISLSKLVYLVNQLEYNIDDAVEIIKKEDNS